MSRLARLLACTALTALLAGTARAEVIWRGDFSTGDSSQWSSKETVGGDRLRVVSDPVPPGEHYSLRTLVKAGDMIYNGNRAELDYERDRPKPGDQRYYHWKTMWPSDYVAPDYWQIFTQWHQYKAGGSPPLAFMVWGEVIKLGSGSRYYWSTPLVRNQWHDFVFHVTWSADEAVGGVEIWYDGEHVLPFTHGATLFPNDTVYLKQGLYRKKIITQDQILYHTGMTVATTLADVMPVPATSGTTEPPATGGTTEPPATGGTTTPPATGGTPSPETNSPKNAGCDTAAAPWALSAVVAAALLMRRRRARLA